MCLKEDLRMARFIYIRKDSEKCIASVECMLGHMDVYSNVISVAYVSLTFNDNSVLITFGEKVIFEMTKLQQQTDYRRRRLQLKINHFSPNDCHRRSFTINWFC